jgi:hypothetical protein
MTTDVACPACQQVVPVPTEQLGQEVYCPGCLRAFTPSAAMTETAAHQPAVPPPVPPPLPDDHVPPEEELAKPLEEEQEAGWAEGPRGDRKPPRRRDDSKGGYFGELTRRQRRMLKPHRGVTILMLAILGVLFSPCCLLAIGACGCGYYAYQMGSHDLQEMYAGRMDRSGENLVKISRIMGIIGMGISAPAILFSMFALVGLLMRAIQGSLD